MTRWVQFLLLLAMLVIMGCFPVRNDAAEGVGAAVEGVAEVEGMPPVAAPPVVLNVDAQAEEDLEAAFEEIFYAESDVNRGCDKHGALYSATFVTNAVMSLLWLAYDELAFYFIFMVSFAVSVAALNAYGGPCFVYCRHAWNVFFITIAVYCTVYVAMGL